MFSVCFKTVLEPIDTLSEERHLSFSLGNYVPDETFSEDTKFVTDRLMIYKDLFRHPMILPYKEISLAYDYCCGDVQSSETFQDYTIDLSNDATSYQNIMERLERWLALLLLLVKRIHLLSLC